MLEQEYGGLNMKLLSTFYSSVEKRAQLDMLKGNITRISTSKDPEEIVSSLGFAVDRLNMLAYSRLKELREMGSK